MIKQNFRYFIVFMMVIAAVVVIGEYISAEPLTTESVERSQYNMRLVNESEPEITEGFMKSYLFPGWLYLMPHDHYILMSGDMVVAEVWRCNEDPDTHSWDWIVYTETSFGAGEYVDGIAVSDTEGIKAAYKALLGTIFI